MQNLAGNPESTSITKRELEAAGIPIMVLDRPQDGEVKSWCGGALHGFTFTRGWYYWRVSGQMPLDQAEKIYSDPVGARDVRVAGHCGCPPPREWAYNLDGRLVVDSYHVDSAEGLRLLADSIREMHAHEGDTRAESGVEQRT